MYNTIYFILFLRISECPLCKKRLTPRSNIPLHLHTNNADQGVQQRQQLDAYHGSTNAGEGTSQGTSDQVGNEATGNVSPIASQAGRRTQYRTQSLIDGIQPGRRTQRRARSLYDRNVRINRDDQFEIANEATNRIIRRSDRVSKPVNRMNICEIVCSVCKKKYRADIPLKFTLERIACSFSCLRNA